MDLSEVGSEQGQSFVEHRGTHALKLKPMLSTISGPLELGKLWDYTARVLFLTGIHFSTKLHPVLQPSLRIDGQARGFRV